MIHELSGEQVKERTYLVQYTLWSDEHTRMRKVTLDPYAVFPSNFGDLPWYLAKEENASLNDIVITSMTLLLDGM